MLEFYDKKVPMLGTARWGWMFALGVAAFMVASCGGRAVGNGEKAPIATDEGAGHGGSSAASGGTAGGAGAVGGACTTPKACGGDWVGDWVVAGSCIDVAGDADAGRLLGIGCATAPIRGRLEVSGSFAVGADGSVRDETTTSGEIAVDLSPQCLDISGTLLPCERVSLAFDPVGGRGTTCTSAGAVCSCVLEVDQKGSMGLISFTPSSSGVASTDRRRLRVEGDVVAEYDYCSDGEKLTVTPRGGGLALNTAGSIELNRQRSR